jgi:predicted Fe-Mo cluster-binding NifX family protein
MKVAVSACGDSLDAKIDKRFGRCAWLVFVDCDTLALKAVSNEYADAPSGAGTGCAQLVVEEEVDAVLSGQVGPNAYQVLKQSGIHIFIAPEDMSVNEAVKRFKKNDLKQMEMKVF